MNDPYEKDNPVDPTIEPTIDRTIETATIETPTIETPALEPVDTDLAGPSDPSTPRVHSLDDLVLSLGAVAGADADTNITSDHGDAHNVDAHNVDANGAGDIDADIREGTRGHRRIRRLFGHGPLHHDDVAHSDDIEAEDR